MKLQFLELPFWDDTYSSMLNVSVGNIIGLLFCAFEAKACWNIRLPINGLSNSLWSSLFEMIFKACVDWIYDKGEGV